jgi:hypothetical protein
MPSEQGPYRGSYAGGRAREGVQRDVHDADTAGAVRPRGPDGRRAGGRRLRGALPQMRDRRGGAGNLWRGAEGAAGVGKAQPAKPVGQGTRREIFGPRTVGSCRRRVDASLNAALNAAFALPGRPWLTGRPWRMVTQLGRLSGRASPYDRRSSWGPCARSVPAAPGDLSASRAGRTATRTWPARPPPLPTTPTGRVLPSGRRAPDARAPSRAARGRRRGRSPASTRATPTKGGSTRAPLYAPYLQRPSTPGRIGRTWVLYWTEVAKRRRLRNGSVTDPRGGSSGAASVSCGASAGEPLGKNRSIRRCPTPVSGLC